MNALTMDSLLDSPKYLPSNRSVVWDLLRTLDQPDVTSTQIVELLNKDPALVSRLLKLANTSFFGVSRQVATTHDAVIVLGLMTVSKMALAASLFSAENPELNVFWKHSLRIAYLSSVVAKWAGQPVEICFAAGLLRGIGLLLLYGHDPVYGKYFGVDWQENYALSQLEYERYGFNHVALGVALANRWQFPALITEAISCSYKQPPEPISMVALTNHFADEWVSLASSEEQEVIEKTSFSAWLSESLELPEPKWALLLVELGECDKAILNTSWGAN